jgi:hypothetical protein
MFSYVSDTSVEFYYLLKTNNYVTLHKLQSFLMMSLFMEHTARVFENGVLRKMLGHKREEATGD